MSAARPTVAVVEDEALARERLAQLVRANPAFDLAAVCANGKEILAALHVQPIDILLLDIGMPGVDGMQVLRSCRNEAQPPLVVLTTAHAQFAIDAFAEEAAGYLLKPFDTAQLYRALDVAAERLRARAAVLATQRVRRALDGIGERAPAENVALAAAAPLMIRHDGRIRFVRPDQVHWVEAQGHVCVLHCGGSKRFEIAGPFSALFRRLPNSFVAVSRSALVNTRFLAELQELFKGNLVAVLQDGTELPVSRRCRAHLLERLQDGGAR